MVARGSTWTDIIPLPFDTKQYIQKIEIIYSQEEVPVLTKTENDCLFDGNKVIVEISQEDSFKFKGNSVVSVEFRILDGSGNVVPVYSTGYLIRDTLSNTILQTETEL